MLRRRVVIERIGDGEIGKEICKLEREGEGEGESDADCVWRKAQRERCEAASCAFKVEARLKFRTEKWLTLETLLLFLACRTCCTPSLSCLPILTTIPTHTEQRRKTASTGYATGPGS
jgi:hypothetical protein